MKSSRSLYLLPGDGIGPEIMQEVRRVVDWLNCHREGKFSIGQGLIGGAALEAHGTPLTDLTVAEMLAADAVVFGAVGGPKWDHMPPDQSPEGVNGLLRMRKELKLHAKVCPIKVFGSLADYSPLKPDRVEGLDFAIVREIASGIYYGEPRGIEVQADQTSRGVNTESYTTGEIGRVARTAFELARKRAKKVTSVDKANILESSRLWRTEVQRIRDQEFADVELEHMYVDNASMQLIRNPKRFDVLLTTNIFGDIMSDAAAGIVGSLGMLPTAELGLRDESGRMSALYQAVHGSAPDIAGQNIANPIGTILSFALALRYSFDMEAEASLLERAVQGVINDGLRTADIFQLGKQRVTTSQMGEAIVSHMGRG